MTPDLAQALMTSAQRIGADPVDLATVISYETAGTFDPWKAGPTTQWGQHRGLIQWGEPQRKQYGVYQGMPVAEQMQAVEKYLVNAGYKPGMGLMDMYSAVNAGRVGRYSASDANNGGAPGTVADKVNNQMGPHRTRAAQMLGIPAGGGKAPAIPAGGTGGLSYGTAQPNIASGSAAAIADMFGPPVMEPAPFIAAPEQPTQRVVRRAESVPIEVARRNALLADVGSWFR